MSSKSLSKRSGDRIALSIVIPAYNEEDRLPQTLAAIAQWRAGWSGGAVEVIVVDDGSTDGTVAAVERRISEWGRPAVRVMRAPHRGKGPAIVSGMHAASGAVCLFMDADLAVPLRHVDCLLDELKRGAHVAIGSREAPGSARLGEPGYRHLMGRVFNRIVALLAVGRIADTQCGFKAFDAQAVRRIFDRVRLYGEDSNIVSTSRVTAVDVEILAIARRIGLRVTEVPVTWRHVPRSKVRPLPDAWEMLSSALRVRWNLWLGRYD